MTRKMLTAIILALIGACCLGGSFLFSAVCGSSGCQ